ncbi:MAG: hypothetical protein ACRD1N_05420 [Terriglobia bacterium]
MRTMSAKTACLTCAGLLLACASSLPQPNNSPTIFPNSAALAAYKSVAARWCLESGWAADRSAASSPEQAMTSAAGDPIAVPGHLARALPQAGAALALDQTQSAAPQQTGQSPNNGLSLEGLGFPPSAIQGSAREQALLNKRSRMLQIHQKLGLLAAIPMVAAIITGPGAKGHHGLPGSPTGREVHAGLGVLTTGMYFASAYYAIRAPKIQGTKSYGLIRLHKAMAWIHGPGMILTPVLGAIAYSQLSRGERVHGIAKYHAWAAYTTAAAYGVAILSVTLK